MPTEKKQSSLSDPSGSSSSSPPSLKNQRTPDRSHSLSPMAISVISSAIAGISGRMLLHPIDTIKSRMQVQIKYHTLKTASAMRPSILQQHRHVYYETTMDAVRKIMSSEGPRGFYRGLGVALAFSGPAQSIYLGSYEQFRHVLSKMLLSEDHLENSAESGEGNFLVHFLAGFGAEAVSCVAWVPHDVLKERMQVERNHDVKLRDVYRQVRADGLRNLYKGYGITLATFGPFSALYFLGYEKMKYAMSQWTGTSLQNLGFGSFLVSASIAAAMSSVLTTPLDVVKTRYQVQRRTMTTMAGDISYYTSIWDGFKKIMRHEGPRALWKGVTARVCYMSPNVAVIMTSYELLKQQFARYFV